MCVICLDDIFLLRDNGNNTFVRDCVTLITTKRLDRFYRKFSHGFLGAKYRPTSLICNITVLTVYEAVMSFAEKNKALIFMAALTLRSDRDAILYSGRV